MVDTQNIKTHYVAAVVLIFGLAGCASTLKEDEQAIQTMLEASAAFTPQEWAKQVDPSEVAKAKSVNWLKDFNDPLLLDFVDQALSNNLDLQAAAANVQKANAMAVQAGAQAKPQLNLAFSSKRSGSSGSGIPETTSNALSAQFDWDADLWGRISQGQRAAVASAQAAAADYRYAQHSMAAAVTRSYLVAVEAEQQITILKSVLDSLRKTERIVTVQYENGLATSQDLALTKSDLASTEEQLITLEASKRDALRALEVLLGKYPKAEALVSQDLPALPSMPPLGLPSDVLERRPDIVASERRVASAYNALNQAKAAKLPQLSLTGNLGGASSSLSDITDPANVAWQLAANLLVPILNGGARDAQVDVATADQEAALAAYAQTALNAFNEVETNLDLATSLIQRKEALETAKKQADKAFRVASLRHKEGEISLLDLLSVQQRVLSADSALSTINRLALEQRVNLYLALGGDW